MKNKKKIVMELRGCSYGYPTMETCDDLVLNKVEITVNKGESVALIGRSGSGKTTLLSLLSTLRKMQSGTYHAFGQSMHDAGPTEIENFRAQYLGFIFQEYALSESKNVSENVEMALLNCDTRTWRMRSTLSSNILNKVGLGDKRSSRVASLSGGERQRVAIARALVKNPKLLFADEPTGALDPKTGDKIIDLLLSLCSETESTLFLVTHDLEVAAKMSRQFLIENGELVEIVLGETI